MTQHHVRRIHVTMPWCAVRVVPVRVVTPSSPFPPCRRLPLALPQTNNGVTALMMACQENMPDVAKLLVAKGADVNAKACGGVDVGWGWHVRRVGGVAAVGGRAVVFVAMGCCAVHSCVVWGRWHLSI